MLKKIFNQSTGLKALKALTLMVTIYKTNKIYNYKNIEIKKDIKIIGIISCQQINIFRIIIH